jgi:hypothetical protein
MSGERIDNAGELHAVIMESLKRRGVLGKISANVRAEVFHTLEDKTVPLPDKPTEVFLATELIREYMMSTSLNSSLSVFNEESGQPNEMRVDREFLGGELGFNIMDESQSAKETPLLILLVTHLLTERRRSELGADDSLDVHEG